VVVNVMVCLPWEVQPRVGLGGQGQQLHSPVALGARKQLTAWWHVVVSQGAEVPR
jgi:hypothetical protein